MKREGFMKKAAGLLIMIAALIAAVPVSVQAKAASNKLKADETYTQYDITGDKKADTLQVTGDWDSKYEMYHSYTVLINGQTVLTKKSNAGPIYNLDIRRLELQNGKALLSIVPRSDNGDVPGAAVYQYKGGKLVKAIDLDLMSKIGFHNSVESIKVSGNKVTVKYWEMSYALGGIGFKLDYVYKNGKMVQKTTKAKVTTVQRKKYWTANRSMKVLKSPGGKKITALTKGKKVKIDKIYINSKHNKIYLHVKIKGGKSGWVKGLTKSTRPGPMFKEVMYAG